MDFSTKTVHNVGRMSPKERQAMADLMRQVNRLKRKKDRQALTERVMALANARAQTQQKRVSDRRTDRQRRTLVGARIPREEAERIQEIAQQTDRSVYRLVLDALEAELNRTEGEVSSDGQDIDWQPLPGTISCVDVRPGVSPGSPGGPPEPLPARTLSGGSPVAPGSRLFQVSPPRPGGPGA